MDLNKDMFEMYINGMSIHEIRKETEIPLSTIRFRLKKAGILRNRGDGVRNAFMRGRFPSKLGVKRNEFSDEWKNNISLSKKKLGYMTSDMISIKPSGYAEFTSGKYKGKPVHVIIMENRIGRTLKEDECVHHIDGDKLNNNDNNLCLMTKSGHARLHVILKQLNDNKIERDKDGKFCK